jgi:HD-GYP domain-containing protein (c-di-GMP phosphodiesterase class II)
METMQKELIITVAAIFKENSDIILKHWIDLVNKNADLRLKDEINVLKKCFEGILNACIFYLSTGDIEGYYRSNAAVAREIAIDDISYSEFVRAFHLFQESYGIILLGSINPNETAQYLNALSQLHHNTLAIISEEYFMVKDATIMALITMSEIRDSDTGHHVKRTSEYALALSKSLELGRGFAENIYKVSPLHDIGKIGVRDSILLKRGELTIEEYEEIKKHSVIGYECIKQIIGNREAKRGYWLMAQEITLSHHERYDGKGYPYGLSGEKIPLSARVFSLADVYDALVSRRPYKKPFAHSEAVKLIKVERGKQFDSRVVDAFLAVQEEFEIICQKYKN